MTQTATIDLTTTCTECGTTREEVELIDRECSGCYVRGCDCVLREDAHGLDRFWCEGCDPGCMCPTCI